MRLGLTEKAASCGPFLAFRFGLTPRGKFAFLRREVRTGFQFVSLTDVAVEVNDLLFGLAFLRHKTTSRPRPYRFIRDCQIERQRARASAALQKSGD